MSKSKQWLAGVKKDGLRNAGISGLNMAGTVGVALAANHDKVKEMLPAKHHGWLLAAVGIANDVLNPEPFTRATLGGAKNYGGLILAAQLTKKPEAYGLTPAACGLVAVTKDGKQTYELAGTVGKTTAKEVDATPWEELAKAEEERQRALEAAGDAPVYGLGNEAAASLEEQMLQQMA